MTKSNSNTPFQFALDPVLPDPVGPHTHKLSGCEVCREWVAGRSVLAESHRRQFNGEDYQAVAQELCDRMKNPRQEDYQELSSSPDPGCDCGFCVTADWWDEPSEPDMDDSVRFCPQCETPNQFGEVCDRCRREIQDEGRTDLEVD